MPNNLKVSNCEENKIKSWHQECIVKDHIIQHGERAKQANPVDDYNPLDKVCITLIVKMV